MCGIVGVLSSNENVLSHILSGLDMLRNRGYDSCGAGLLMGSGEEFLVKKFGSTTTTSNAHNLLKRWVSWGRKGVSYWRWT